MEEIKNSPIEPKTEAKPRSIRITDETAADFKEFCSKFQNQTEALNSLLSTYKVHNAANVLTDRQFDISNFGKNVQALQSAYLEALRLAEEAETDVRKEFQQLLTSKDQIIQELQDRIQRADQEKQNVDEARQIAEERTVQLETIMNNQNEEHAELIDSLKQELQSVNERITEKDEFIESLKKQLKIAEETSRQSADDLQTLKSELSIAKQAQQAAEQEVAKLAKEALADQKRVTAEKEKLIEKYQNEINDYQAEHKLLLSKYKETLEELYAVKEELAQLNASTPKSSTTSNEEEMLPIILEEETKLERELTIDDFADPD